MEQSRFEQKLENHEYAKGSAVAWRRKALSLARRRSDVISTACDLVGLWENPKIRGLPRSERNAAIEQTRAKLIEAVHAFNPPAALLKG